MTLNILHNILLLIIVMTGPEEILINLVIFVHI